MSTPTDADADAECQAQIARIEAHNARDRSQDFETTLLSEDEFRRFLDLACDSRRDKERAEYVAILKVRIAKRQAIIARHLVDRQDMTRHEFVQALDYEAHLDKIRDSLAEAGARADANPRGGTRLTGMTREETMAYFSSIPYVPDEADEPS